MAPPFWISNRSDIPIEFYQTDIREELAYLRTVIKPHQSIDYTWDDHSIESYNNLSITDGNKGIYDLLKLGPGNSASIGYYIYLVFQQTFNDENLLNSQILHLIHWLSSILIIILH